jgi:hypothetical protein
MLPRLNGGHSGKALMSPFFEKKTISRLTAGGYAQANRRKIRIMFVGNL